MKRIWAHKALLPHGWAENVLVSVGHDGRIADIASSTPIQGHSCGILLPAPVNVHSHSFQRAMAGLTEQRGPKASDNFWTWRKLMFRFLERLTPEHVEAIAAFVQMEMLEAGYTTKSFTICTTIRMAPPMTTSPRWLTASQQRAYKAA